LKRFGLLVIALGLSAVAQTSAWTVKPEWVMGHEAFLASDAMGGRGSATHEEEVAAAYVASEFEGYGLVHAPGRSSYIQSAQVLGPRLDGHAVLTVGAVTLEEGKDFDLLMSPGESRQGSLAVVRAADAAKAKVAKGAAVLVTDVPEKESIFYDARELSGAEPTMVLTQRNEITETMYTMFGGKTRLPVWVEGSPEKQGHMTLVALSAEAAAKLKAAGGAVVLTVHPVVGVAPRETYNAVGYLPGTDPKAGTILLTAHLDHLGMGRPVDGDAIWNGADDDAAGTTAVLELAHALAAGPKLRRSVLFVCYGSEELGELGSTYFGAHSPVPLKELVANLEFEMIGNQDPKMPKGVLLLTGWDRSNLGSTLKEHGALLGPDPYPEEHFFERSDNYALALKGVVAHTAAGWGDVPTYHHPNDDLAHLDVAFMTAAIQSLVEPVRWLAESDFVPKWNPGGKPEKP
jgi:aminopeptidase YwaD